MIPLVHELDVRPLLASGQQPIDTILHAIAGLPAGAALQLLTPFEPQPLYSKLAGLGFEHSAQPQADGSFTIRFTPRTLTLDLRLLEPPAPLQQTLEATAVLEPRARIVSLTRFRPVHLLALLAERGFTATSTEQPDGSWENVIVHATVPAAALAPSGDSAQ